MTGTNVSTAASGATHQIDTITLSDTSPASVLIAGDSVTVSGLVYTCPSGTTVSAATVATAFAAFITSGTPTTNFTTTDGSLLADKYNSLKADFTASAASGVLTLTSVNAGTHSPPSLVVDTRFTAIANCQIATTSLANQITTISSAQSSLSAATTGLKAQLETANALGTGVQKTIDSIANVDATELQAFLQNLNTQQSVDYYLVSQMNQASAAILSIFR
nr:flagellin [Polynucleobacter sp. CS-Odin-A6]